MNSSLWLQISKTHCVPPGHLFAQPSFSTVRLQVHLHTACCVLSEPLLPAAGTAQCRAPALTPRAAHGKAIRARVPLKKGTERNTTALNTMPRLPFPPAPLPTPLFFSFSSWRKFLQDPVLLSAFSIYFPSWSLPDLSHPRSFSLIALNPNMPLGFHTHSLISRWYWTISCFLYGTTLQKGCLTDFYLFIYLFSGLQNQLAA